MKTKNEKKTAVGYVRTAVVKQVGENNSLEHQEQKIKEHCQENDYELTGIISDSGKSGANLKRPGLKRLLATLKRGGIKAIVCTNPDRISRTIPNYLDFKALVEKYGAKLTFIDLSPYPECLDEMVTGRSLMGDQIRRGMRKKGK